jgi:tetratricopeptide (TPR) repeat protein
MFELGKQHGDVLVQISALNKQANLLALRMGRMEEAEPLLLKVEELARAYQDKVGLGEMFVIRCQISVGSADFDTAMHYMGDAIQVGKDLDVKEQIAWGLDHLSGTYTFMMRFDEAWQVSLEAWALAEEIGNREFQSGVLTTQLYLHWRNGDFDAAIAAGEQAADIAELIGLSMQIVFGKWGAGWVLWQRGDYRAAVQALEDARRAAEPFEEFMPFLSVLSKASLGSVMLDAGIDRATALNYHKHALELAETPVGGMANGSAWADIGKSAFQTGDFDLAQKLFEGALVYPSFFRLVMRPRNLLGLAELAHARDDFAAARGFIDEARTLADEKAIRPYQATLALAEGKLEAAQGNHERALELFADAEGRASTMKMRPTILEARTRAAASLDALARPAEAETKRAEARTIQQEIADLMKDEEPHKLHLEMQHALE